MILHNDIHFGPDGLADGSDALFNQIHIIGLHQAGALLLAEGRSIFIEGKEVNLDGVITLRDSFLCILDIRFGGVSRNDVVIPTELKLTGIGAQMITTLAPQQNVQRRVQGLTTDIPKGHIQCGQARKEHRATVLAPEGLLIDAFPDDLVLHGIHADDQVAQIPDHAERAVAAGAIGHRGLSVTINAFIRVDTAANGVPRGIIPAHRSAGFSASITAFNGVEEHNVNFCDFHLLFSPFHFIMCLVDSHAGWIGRLGYRMIQL